MTTLNLTIVSPLLALGPAALCTQTDPEIFFPERGMPATAAKKVCRRCPIIDQCRIWVTANPQPYGVWAGMSAGERRRRALATKMNRDAA